MKKKYSVLLIIICLVTFISSGIISLSDSIVTERQSYLKNTPNVSDTVSARELAMLASLVYEDVPNDYKYEKNNYTKGCLNQDGSLKNKSCFFKDYGRNKIKGSKYEISSYIEGMSERKMGFVTSITSSFKEEGQIYYFSEFANIKELTGWSIFDYKSEREGDKDPDKVLWNNYFDAITFKKDNDYVIAYRGTDFPDLAEWIADVGYAIFGGRNSQTKQAYEYAQSVYEKIIKDNTNANIYVTGHSLGAYLAQVGGAAIVDKEATDKEENGLDVYATKNALNVFVKGDKLEDYEEVYNETNSRLKQVAYFNGMGVNGLFYTAVKSKNIDNALIYLSTHNQDGSRAIGNRTVNYSDNLKSSGRLVLYTMEGDPISNIGFHYGEVYELNVGTRVLENHVGNHPNILNSEGVSDVATAITNIFNGKGVSNNIKTENLSKTIASLIKLSEKMPNLITGENIPDFISNYNPDMKKYSVMSLITNLLNGKAKLSDKYNVNGLIDFFNVGHETDSFVCLTDGVNGTVDSDGVSMFQSLSLANSSKLYTLNNPYDLYLGSNYAEYKGPDNYKPGDFIDFQGDYIVFGVYNKGICTKGFKYEYSLDGITWKPIIGRNGSDIIHNSHIAIPDSIIDEALENTEPENGEYTTKVIFRVTVLYGDKYTELKSITDKANGTISYEGISSCVSNNGIACNDSEYYEYKFMNAYGNRITTTLDIFNYR